MKENNKAKELIKETIEQVLLNEQEDYGAEYNSLGGIYGDYYDSLGYGSGGGGGKAGSIMGVLPIGVIPQVAKTLLWGVENMSQRVITLLRNLFAFFTKAFIPGLSALADYKQIRQDELAGLAKIDKKYAETLQANLDVLKNLDAWGIVFLLDPTLGLGWRLVEKTPGLAIQLLDALSGGKAVELFKSYMQNNDIKPNQLDYSTRSFFSQIGMTDFGLAEASDAKPNLSILKDFLNSKEVKQAVASSGVMPKVKTFARNAINARVNKVLATKTIEELIQKAPELAEPAKQALAQLTVQSQQQRLSPEEFQKAKLGLLGKIKEDYKKMTVSNLSAAGQQNKGISGIVSGIIKQIQAMK